MPAAIGSLGLWGSVEASDRCNLPKTRAAEKVPKLQIVAFQRVLRRGRHLGHVQVHAVAGLCGRTGSLCRLGQRMSKGEETASVHLQSLSGYRQPRNRPFPGVVEMAEFQTLPGTATTRSKARFQQSNLRQSAQSNLPDLLRLFGIE